MDPDEPMAKVVGPEIEALFQSIVAAVGYPNGCLGPRD